MRWCRWSARAGRAPFSKSVADRDSSCSWRSERGFDVTGVELNADHAAEARDRTNGSQILCADFMMQPFTRRFDLGR